MDNNPKPINTAPIDPAPVTNIVQEPPVSSGNNKMWLIVIIVVLILVIGGMYWYMNSQQKVNQTTQAEPSPATASQNVDSLDKDLSATSLNDVDKEFSSVDTDLGSL